MLSTTLRQSMPRVNVSFPTADTNPCYLMKRTGFLCPSQLRRRHMISMLVPGPSMPTNNGVLQYGQRTIFSVLFLEK